MGSTEPTAPSYSAPPETVTFDALLFDMDGTIIDSTNAVVKHWETIGEEIGVDPEVILQTSHGRRTIDTLKVFAPEKATWEYTRHLEGLLPKLHGADATEIPGARPLLEGLIAQAAPWTIVTSGSEPLVTGWLDVLNLPLPAHIVTAESVSNGKPDPACYLLGRDRLLGSDNSSSEERNQKQVLVLEDSPAGIRAGKDAGCKVLAVVTSHTVEQVLAAGPDWVVRDLDSVKLVRADGQGATLEIRDALVREE
ncbi:HAD-like protein [Chaetomium sp. MPI-SDFR-AT-0129]|nr:HAD-like protein [Chaetomium sp. MPI-SDFR-AT-0129]